MLPIPLRPVAVRSAAALACFAMAGLSAFAQNPGSSPANESGDVVTLSPFEVSGTTADQYRAEDAISAVRVRAALIDTPSSISVLTRDVMDDLAPNRIFDATRFVAGVQEGRGIQFQDRMIIRGFETQNGARTVDNFLQSADADNIDEVIVDRIEVSKGPNAILSPAGAPGGAVNIITKSPLYTEQSSVTGEVGLYDAQKISIDLAGPFSKGSPLAYRLVGAYQDSRRYWSSDAMLRGRVLAPMLSYKVSDKSMLTLKIIAASHWIYREPLLILDPSVGPTTSSPFLAPGLDWNGLNGIQPWSSVRTHSADAFLTFTTTLSEHISLRLAGNARYYFEDDVQEFLSTPSLNNRYNPMTGQLTQDYTWAKDPNSGQYVSTFSPFFNPHNIPVRGQAQWTRRKTGNFEGDLAANYKFDLVSSQTVAGYAFSRQTGYSRVKDPGTLPGLDLSNQNVTILPVFPANLTADNGASYTNNEIYINERLGFFNDRLFVTGGLLRYYTVTKAWNILSPTTPPSVLDDNKDMWLATALYKIRDNISVYYSHSTNSSPVIANNLPLWRSGVQDEVGAKSEFFDKRLSFTAAWFKIAQTNVTVPNPAYQTDPTQPQQLVSDLKNHGLEFELMGSITPQLSAIATYTDLHMRDSLGRMVRGVADNTASLLLNFHGRDGWAKDFTLYGGGTYTSKRAGDVPSTNFTPLGAVTQVSFYLKPQFETVLGATYRWNKDYLFRLTIDNVFDNKNYIAVAGGRVSGTGLTTEPGINVRLSVTYDF